MRTHYDNLKVPRNADADSIRAAYRRLSKQYHPDYNPNPDAHRVMQIINRAYDVLSDPQKRAAHDRWIAEQEAIEAQTDYQIIVRPQQAVAAAQPPQPQKRLLLIGMVAFCVCLTALLGWQITYAFRNRPEPQTIVIVQQQPSGSPAAVSGSSYTRSAAAPNGVPYPQNSGYLSGYPQSVSTHGQYRLYIENIRNSSDVFAELYTLDNPQVLRTFFIKERSQFMLDNLDAGTYAVRYRQLDDGEELHSESIALNGGIREATIYLQRGKSPAAQ